MTRPHRDFVAASEYPGRPELGYGRSSCPACVHGFNERTEKPYHRLR